MQKTLELAQTLHFPPPLVRVQVGCSPHGVRLIDIGSLLSLDPNKGQTGTVRKRIKVQFVEAARYDEADLRLRLGLFNRSDEAQRLQSYLFRARHRIRRLPGGFYDKATVEAALRKDAGE